MSTSRNTVYNIAGAVVSLVITVVTVPLYIHQIGEARYGVLAIVWMLLGYFGLFDMGLSRATAQAVAANVAAGAKKQNDIVWAALLANLASGAIGGIVLWFAAHWILGGAISVAGQWRREVLDVLPWVAAAVPIATTTSIFSGTLLGRSRFLELNALSVLGTALFQIVPVCFAYAVGPSLNVVIPAAVGARVLSSLPFALVCWRTVPLVRPHRRCLGEIAQLLRFGMWVSGANVVGPLLAGADRLVIGAMAGARAVTFYVVPMSLANRLTIMPGSLAGALFPRYAAGQDSAEARRHAKDMFVLIALVLLPVTSIAIAILPAFLTLWIGKAFSQQAALTGQILLIGVWLNCPAQIPFTRLQATGRPDLAVKFYAIELVPYLMSLWGGLKLFGVAGAAAAWSLRTGADMLLLANGARLGRAAMVKLIPGLCLLTAAVVLSRWSPVTEIEVSAQFVITAGATFLAWRQLSEEMRGALSRKWAAMRSLALNYAREF